MKHFQAGNWIARYKNEAEIDLASNWIGISNDLLQAFIGDIPTPQNWDYAHMYGFPQLRAYIARENNCSIEKVIVTHGAQEALFLLSLIFGKSKSEIILPRQIYHLSEMFTDRGSAVHKIQLSLENQFKPQLSVIQSLVTPKTKLIALNSPHNPSGSMINQKDRCSLVGFAKSRNIYLLIDEVYRDICFIKQSEVPDACHDLYEKGISIYSLSKAFGLPGLRIGYIIGPEEVIKECRQLREYTTGGNSVISETIALQVLKNKEKILTHVTEDIYYNYHIVQQWLEANTRYFDWIKPQGGLSFFPKLKIPISDVTFCKEILHKKKVLLLPGSFYESPGHMRISLSQEPYSVLPEGLDRLSKFLQEYYPI